MTDQYIPGACNIGPEEIALRRRFGHASLAVTAALAAALLRSNLHPAWRLTLALPAAGAASGYLQARQRFCANFGYRGVYNFDTRGHEQQVASETAQAEDRRRALQIAAASADRFGRGRGRHACVGAPHARLVRESDEVRLRDVEETDLGGLLRAGAGPGGDPPVPDPDPGYREHS